MLYVVCSIRRLLIADMRLAREVPEAGTSAGARAMGITLRSKGFGDLCG
jgi:hypothetical protein